VLPSDAPQIRLEENAAQLGLFDLGAVGIHQSRRFTLPYGNRKSLEHGCLMNSNRILEIYEDFRAGNGMIWTSAVWRQKSPSKASPPVAMTSSVQSASTDQRAPATGFWARGSERATDRIRFMKHEAIPGCGSFEVRFPDDPIGRAGTAIGTVCQAAGSDRKRGSRNGAGECGGSPRTGGWGGPPIASNPAERNSLLDTQA
jgi:hypothetical protein